MFSRSAAPPHAGLILVALVAALCSPRDAQAVPVFARKYETSCQTCHVAFPKLTPFGEAFRRNGHRFPGEEEESTRKQEPVLLGQDAHKRLFPSAVWPGQVPSSVPLSVQLSSSIAYQPTGLARPSFAGVGANLGLNLAATLGDHLSAWAGAFVRATPSASGGETTAASLERVFLTVTPFDQPWLLLRIGRFEPDVLSFSSHRAFGLPSWLGSKAIGSNPFTLEPAQLGLEGSGVLGGKTAYSLGVVEGANGLLNSSKDVYARIAYKLGGMRLDGVGGATDSEAWRERSVTLSAFGYSGQARIGAPGVAEQTDRFWLVGAELNALYRDANLQLAFVRRDNHRPMLEAPNQAQTGWSLLTQFDYVAYPWLVPTLRYERDLAGANLSQRVSGGLYVLARANVRAQLLASAALNNNRINLDQLIGGVNLAF